jgi:Cysteine-rich CPXCG
VSTGRLAIFQANFQFNNEVPPEGVLFASLCGSPVGVVKGNPFRIVTVNAGFQCAGCGEWNETGLDESAGRTQIYVEDCQICCKPNLLRARYDPERQQYSLQAELE